MTSEILLRELVLLELGLWSSVGQLIAERPLFVLGHVCTDDGCGAIAPWLCYWPGQTRAKCTAHRQRWARVAETMGFTLAYTALEVRRWPEPDPSAARFAAMELY